MKAKLLTLITLLIIFVPNFAQRKYTQLYQTAAKMPVISNGNSGYVFENDTVKITYKFWAERGVFYFDIFNKLSVPLYIDWKKSSMIRNKNKFNYYEDVERKKMSMFYKNFTVSPKNWTSVLNPKYEDQIKKCGADYWVNEKGSEAYLTPTKAIPERITFIAPSSTYTNYQYTYNITQAEGTELKLDTYFEEVTMQDYDGPVKTRIYKAKYTPEESVLDFRNFLTLSTSEKFDSEFYVDNGFFISSILEMDNVQFITANFKYCNPTSFFVTLPKKASITYRKNNENFDERIRGVQ